MSIARHHADWLSLIEVSGPFVSLPVMQRAFPHGLPDLEPGLISEVRAAYADWQENGGTTAATHAAWVQYVLQRILGFPPDLITSGQTLPPGLEARVDTFHETLRPDFAILPPTDRDQRRTVLLVRVYSPQQRLESPLMGVVWKASPAARMMELLHATDLPLGLVTNGEEWQLVFAPKNESTGFASWFADLWLQEPVTLRAFQALLGQHRFFGVADDDTPAALLKASLKDQHEVTDSLGAQVRQAVELLVRDFDRLDIESNRALLAGLKEAEIYNASLTVMMRLVFLFCAEEKGLLRLGEDFYDSHYAVSTLRQQLREIADQRGEEVLERRSDAWCRLLATFRAVHGGVAHDAMRLPPYGGTLFDPDRFPFLEGRAPGSPWRSTQAQPPHINNRVVLHLLEALQILRIKLSGGGPAEARRLSFRSLDIEQIGHVYEGLLDHTARRAEALTLGLEGTKKKPAPIATLEDLETLAARGNDDLVAFLKELTDRTPASIEKDLGLRDATRKGKQKASPADASAPLLPESTISHPQSAIDEHLLTVACHHDTRLIARVRAFAGLMRRDSFDQLVLIPNGSLHVAPGNERRSTGTHYTPRILTEPIVQHTLEPLVYHGPAEGLPQSEWKPKSPKEILALKVCDMAMGSGAFLVQVCRYLAERLVEAWQLQEKDLPKPDPSESSFLVVLPDGSLSNGSSAERLLPADTAERIAMARRYVADRCLYGVDINPMAVEMAKLSLWLITLQRDRPFTFLDHALKCGDSLLGVSSVQQIENFSLRPGERQVTFATANLFRYVDEASAKRRALEDLPSNDHTQIETKNRLHAEAEAATAKVKAVADSLIALELRDLDGDAYEDQRTDEAEKVQLLMKRDADASLKPQTSTINQLSAHAREQLRGRRTFHWPVEFPEVFARGGFDAFVGNPPFLGSKYWASAIGDYIVEYSRHILGTNPGRSDICALFHRRALTLLSAGGYWGLLGTESLREGDSRAVGLDKIVEEATIYRATPSLPWPGTANVTVCVVWVAKAQYAGVVLRDSIAATAIDGHLDAVETTQQPFTLQASCLGAKGCDNSQGEPLILTESHPWFAKLRSAKSPFLRRYVTAEDLNDHGFADCDRWVVHTLDLSLDEVKQSCFETFKFLTEYVRPLRPAERLKGLPGLDKRWWQFNRPSADLYSRLRKCKTCIVIPVVSKYVLASRVPSDWVFTNKFIAFAEEREDLLGLMQSDAFRSWVQKYSGSLGGTMSVSLKWALNSFPFPRLLDAASVLRSSQIESLFRKVVAERHVGYTDICNCFHDRGEQSADIARLRTLHVEMDQAVAAAYGWSDLDLGHGFHATKQGERYTLSEPARRTVLDRLLALNHQRYEEEVKAGLHEKKKGKATKPTGTRSQKAPRPATAIESRALPSDWRFTSPSPELYAINLITALLSARPDGLPWPTLRDAFAAATTPSLMVQLALPDDRQIAETWAKRWNEEANPEFLIPALRAISGSNLEVEGGGPAAVFSLKDGPKPPATEDVDYDAWLALRVIGSMEVPSLEYAEKDTLDAGLEELLAV